jgi:hypothetical protein
MGLVSHCGPMNIELGVRIDRDIGMIMLNIHNSIDSKVQI